MNILMLIGAFLIALAIGYTTATLIEKRHVTSAVLILLVFVIIAVAVCKWLNIA